MRRILAVVAAVTLSLPVAVLAQDNPRRDRGGPQSDSQTQQQAPAPREDRAPARDGGFLGRVNPNQAQPAPSVTQERGRRAPNTAQVAPNRPTPAPNFVQTRDRGGNFRGNSGRDGRSFTFRGRQYSAFRAPAFSYPRGWGYRHWGPGEFLPSIFLAAPFYFDYGWLGLPPPPPGARWVRNGPDALLVSVYDGRIIDVIYDAFY